MPTPIPQPRNLLHGVTLEAMLTALVAAYGWPGLAERIALRCFTQEPTIGSSLKVLRKNPWAREKVESLYLFMLREARRSSPAPVSRPPRRINPGVRHMPSSTITLTAADGFASSAYVAEPSGTPKGAIVVLQEIFGVNSHIRSVADGYAAAGYLAIAPSTFDRVERGVQLGYTADDIAEGARLKAAVEALPAPGVLHDIQAAVDHVAKAGKVGIVGYCWGGLLVWRSAEKVTGLAAAVAYYGGGMTVGTEPSRRPAVPTMAHFGDQDAHISVESVKAFEQAQPEVEVHLYAANHGFNCDQRGSYHAGAAATALERSLYHFGKHVG